LIGCTVEAVTVSRNAPSLSMLPIRSCCGSAERRQRNLPKRRVPFQRGKRYLDLPQEIAGRQNVVLVAGDEAGDRDCLLSAIGLPDGADAVERRGKRDHRACRQRHAEIAADGGGLPDLEGRQGTRGSTD